MANNKYKGKQHSELKNAIFNKLARQPNLFIYNSPTGAGRSLTGNFVVRYGFPGLADISGFKKIIVTPEMVGTEIAQAVFIEVKTGNATLSKEQKSFKNKVESLGGLFIEARSLDIEI